MEDDDNIIPYETSPTLTVKQAVMYMLGYRGEFTFHISDTEQMTFNLYNYVYNLQEVPDSAVGNARYELYELKQNDKASPEEIRAAEEKIEHTKAISEEAKKFPIIAEQYRLMINHEISRVQLGKRSSLVIDKDESDDTGQLRINTASFEEWLGEMDLDDVSSNYERLPLPIEEDDFKRAIEGKSAESLHLTLGLLVSLFAESSGKTFGTGKMPNISRIAKEIFEHSKKLNDKYPMEGQGIERIKDRIETGKRAFELYVFGEDLAKKYQK